MRTLWLIAGARFQPQKALYLTMADSGENQKEKLSRALHHAAALAALSGAEQLVIHFDPNDSKSMIFVWKMALSMTRWMM